MNTEQSEQSLDKIRELLFGEETRETKRRFEQLEKRLINELRAIEKRLGDRVASVETALQVEVTALSQAVDAESEQRSEMVNGALEKVGALGERVTRLNEEQQAALDGAREQLETALEVSKDDALARSQAVSDGAGQKIDGLRASKVDREDLAGMLQDLARRLGPADKQG